jgi:hypothetical protein
MPQSAEDAVAAVEQRRIDALLTSDINVLDAIIDEHCTHIGPTGRNLRSHIICSICLSAKGLHQCY